MKNELLKGSSHAQRLEYYVTEVLRLVKQNRGATPELLSKVLQISSIPFGCLKGSILARAFQSLEQRGEIFILRSENGRVCGVFYTGDQDITCNKCDTMAQQCCELESLLEQKRTMSMSAAEYSKVLADECSTLERKNRELTAQLKNIKDQGDFYYKELLAATEKLGKLQAATTEAKPVVKWWRRYL